jgi:hypothetical protein
MAAIVIDEFPDGSVHSTFGTGDGDVNKDIDIASGEFASSM